MLFEWTICSVVSCNQQNDTQFLNKMLLGSRTPSQCYYKPYYKRPWLSETLLRTNPEGNINKITIINHYGIFPVKNYQQKLTYEIIRADKAYVTPVQTSSLCKLYVSWVPSGIMPFTAPIVPPLNLSTFILNIVKRDFCTLFIGNT